ncbi:MAG: ribokinase [Actinomycetota bacterium]
MSAPDVAVVGSLNLDLVTAVDRVPHAGETVLGGDLARYPGGKGANQAVAAGRLGSATAMCGRIGDDEAGSILLDSLAGAGVDTDGVRRTSGVPTGTALIAVEAGGDNAIVVSPGANARLGAEDVLATPAVATAATVLVQLEISSATVDAAAATASGRVILNPAPAPDSLPSSLLERVDVLVPNEHELGLLAGVELLADADLAEVAAAARILPVDLVVATLGARGALVVEGDRAEHVPAPVIEPVDTTAAGDSFCAALAGRLAAGVAPDDAVAWAVRVGAATALVAGAQPSLPTPAEVDERLAGRPGAGMARSAT